MAILQEPHSWLGGWTGRHREIGEDGQTDMKLMGVDRMGKWVVQTLGL